MNVRAQNRSVSRIFVRTAACLAVIGMTACIHQPPTQARRAGLVDDKVVLVPPGAEEGARLARSHLWTEALAEWQRVAATDAQNHALQYDLGLAHEMLGDRDAAAIAYQAALTLKEDALYVASLARVLETTGQGKDHFPLLAGHATFETDRGAAARGELYARQGLWDAAETIWKPACEERGDSDACYDLGVAAEMRDDAAAAEQWYAKAAGIAPLALYGRGLRRVKQADAQSTPDLVVTTTASNVRAGPGTTFERVALLPEQTEVEKLAEQDGWVQIRLDDGREAWVYGTLVTEVVDAAEPDAPEPVTEEIASAAGAS